MKKRIAIIFIIALGFCTQIFAQLSSEKINEMVNTARDLKSLIQSDPHRPSYHITMPEGFAHPYDPNGAIYWIGKYHLGYIYQKYRNGKYEHVWGHLVSTDLLHWTQYPDMITISDGDIEEGVFSGGTFMSREGKPFIAYHGEGSQTNLLAYSDDEDLRVWKKYEGNPVLRTPVAPDPMAGKYTAWDPECWFDKKADAYYMISGGRPATFFKSKDLKKWDFLGDLIAKEESKQYDFEDISCPDFFQIGNKQMILFIGHYLGSQYYIGQFGNDKFSVEQYGRMNWPGGTFFAPEQLVDDKGRNIIWGWVLERKPEHLANHGWSGVMSLPRVLSLSKEGTLEIKPAEELKSLRLEEASAKHITLKANEDKVLPSRGKSLEIALELQGSNSSPYGVKVFCSPDGREETVIKYDPQSKELVIDFIRSSVKAPVEMIDYCLDYMGPEVPNKGTVTEQRAPFELKVGEKLRLNIFIDKSVIEVFANDRQCMTQVVYPELVESSEVRVFSGNDALTVENLKIWKMGETNIY